MAEITAFEAVVAEAQAAVAVARDEMQRTIGLNRKEFDDIVVPIEQKRAAPWLINGGGESQTLVVMVQPDGTAPYRPATADELRDGVYYKDYEEYQATQKAA